MPTDRPDPAWGLHLGRQGSLCTFRLGLHGCRIVLSRILSDPFDFENTVPEALFPGNFFLGPFLYGVIADLLLLIFTCVLFKITFRKNIAVFKVQVFWEGQ